MQFSGHFLGLLTVVLLFYLGNLQTSIAISLLTLPPPPAPSWRRCLSQRTTSVAVLAGRNNDYGKEN